MICLRTGVNIKAGFKVTMRNTKIGNTYVTETDAKGETRIDAEYGNYSVIISKVADVDGISKFRMLPRFCSE